MGLIIRIGLICCVQAEKRIYTVFVSGHLGFLTSACIGFMEKENIYIAVRIVQLRCVQAEI